VSNTRGFFLGEEVRTVYLWKKKGVLYMKFDAEKRNKKTLKIKTNRSLNAYDQMVLFPEKLKKANEVLEKVGLPEQWAKSDAPE